MDDDSVIEDEDKILKEIFKFYSDLYKFDPIVMTNIEGCCQVMDLITPFIIIEENEP